MRIHAECTNFTQIRPDRGQSSYFNGLAIRSRIAMPTSPSLKVRTVETEDFAGWLPLWHGYNAFYGREGETALPDAVTQVTWERFFDPAEPVFALVAVD